MRPCCRDGGRTSADAACAPALARFEHLLSKRNAGNRSGVAVATCAAVRGGSLARAEAAISTRVASLTRAPRRRLRSRVPSRLTARESRVRVAPVKSCGPSGSQDLAFLRRPTPSSQGGQEAGGETNRRSYGTCGHRSVLLE